MSKVVFILSDGLRYDTAVAGMGYLGHLVEARLASLYKVIGQVPSISRPMYETTHTGLPVSEQWHRLECRCAPLDQAERLSGRGPGRQEHRRGCLLVVLGAL